MVLVYKALFKHIKPLCKNIIMWWDGTISALQDCFALTDWRSIHNLSLTTSRSAQGLLLLQSLWKSAQGDEWCSTSEMQPLDLKTRQPSGLQSQPFPLYKESKFSIHVENQWTLLIHQRYPLHVVGHSGNYGLQAHSTQQWWWCLPFRQGKWLLRAVWDVEQRACEENYTSLQWAGTMSIRNRSKENSI